MPAHRLWMKSGASGRAIDLEHPAIHRQDHDKRQYCDQQTSKQCHDP